ncbi:MAG: arsenate reductase ArsC [Phycisphaerales bacterium]
MLFLCTGNSCRSQMAEGWARALLPAAVDPYSAGTEPGQLNQFAVRAMAEAGVDISRQRPKHVDALAGQPFHLVVTVCDAASQACPRLPGATRVVHRSFDDPPALAARSAAGADPMPHYRRVRDEIRSFVQTLPLLLQGEPHHVQ